MMTKQEFEQNRSQWVKDWFIKSRPLDLDFETYMIMNGLTKEQYHYLNNLPEHIKVDYEWIEKNISNYENILKTNISNKEFFQGKLDVLKEILASSNSFRIFTS
jgi:hypothetical protein